MRLLVATKNQGKLREYRELLSDLPVDLVSLPDLGIDVDVEESGDSFAENARLKAESYCRLSGLCTLADDSGLSVDALSGRPGVQSARYGGPGLSDAQRVRLLLSELDGVPWERRTAHFIAVIAVACPDGETWMAEGQCDGYIALEPIGANGFGYDPVFFVPGPGQTMAQLLEAEKNLLSHRGMAARNAAKILAEHLHTGR